MPSYTFDFITADGPQHEVFTLDQDKPVGAQVRRVIAELRQRNVVLLGGRDDVLRIEWNGAAVDEHLTPDSLGLTAHRPLELRMQPRRVAPVEVRAVPRSGRPRTPFVPVSVVSGAVLGGVSGALTWTVLAVTPVAVYSNQDRDAIAIVALLGCIGLLTVIAQHGWRRRLGVALLAVCVGVALTTSIGIALSATTADANAPFLVQRLVLFVTLGTLGATMLSLAAPAPGPAGAVLEAAALGAMAGLACGLLDSAESLGVAGAIAWPLFGALLGAVSCWPRLRRAYALCELLPSRGGLLAPFRMRSYALYRGDVASLADGTVVTLNSGGVLWTSPVPLLIGGQGTSGSGTTVNGDRVQVGGRVYRFREMP